MELFDLESDPEKMKTLAVDREANGELLLTMNTKLTRLVEYEVCEDTGQGLPAKESGWTVTVIDP